jgi:uncharacterized protein YjiS (DUF1127 family)
MTNPILLGRRAEIARIAGAGAVPIARLAQQLSGAISRYLRNRRVERQLWDMPEYQLRDLGFTRGEIRKVAWRHDA